MTKDGRDWLVISLAELHIPLDWDPSSNVFIAVAAPSAGFGTAQGNFPALVKGDAGFSPTIEGVDFTALAYDDPTPDLCEFTETAPATDLSGPVYRLTLALHMGPPGEDGTTSIDLDSIAGTALAGKLIRVNATTDGFEFVYPSVRERYIPATFTSIGSGNANATIGVVSIPVQNTDVRVEAVCQTIVTPAGGTDIVVDLLARLNGETGGTVIGRAFGLSGLAKDRMTIAGIPPAGSSDTDDKIVAGSGPTTVHFRLERQSGSSTYTTAASTTIGGVRIHSI